MNYPNLLWQERIHLFRPEYPGKYIHYSKPIGDKWGQDEKVEEVRYYTWSEVESWLRAHDDGLIGEDEILRLKRGIMVNPDEADAKRGIFRNAETAEEPPYNQDGKPKPTTGDKGFDETHMIECPICGAFVWDSYMPSHNRNYHMDGG